MRKGFRHTTRTKNRMSLSHIGLHVGSKNGMYGKHPTSWNKGLTKETDLRVQKHSEMLIGHVTSEETKKKILRNRSPLEPCLHHRDLNHGNNATGNRVTWTREKHNRVHAQMARRGVQFIQSAVVCGLVDQKFYENYLVYINQEEQKLPEIQTIAEEKTSEMIN